LVKEEGEEEEKEEEGEGEAGRVGDAVRRGGELQENRQGRSNG